MPINPYARWLGLPESLLQPNYFELLGLPKKIGGDSTDDDSGDFQVKQLVSQAAKQKLRLLTQVAPSDKAKHGDVIGKLQQRINRAAETLSDPGKRSAYLSKIERSAYLNMNKIGNSDVPTNQRQSEIEGRPASIAPPLPLTIGRAKSTRPPTKKSDKSDCKVDADNDIPFAVPLQQAPSSPAVADQHEDEAPILPLAIPVATTRISNRQRRRKNQVYQWIVGLIAIALCGGLAVLLFWMANQPTTQDDTPVQAEHPAAKALPSEEEMIQRWSEQPPIQSEGQGVGGAQVENLDGNVRNQDVLEKGNLGKADPALGKTDPMNWPSDRPTDGLSEIEQYHLERQIRQMIFWMGQRDFDKFRIAIGRIEESLLQWQAKLEMAADSDPQHFATLLTAELRRIDQLYNGFWQQFELGLNRLSGGDELTYQQNVVAFVEKSESEVVIRDAGRNLRYFWQHLPASLAIEIGQQAAIADIPTWRLQQAVFLATRPIENPNNMATFDQRLNQAAADGHPTNVLRQLLTHHFFGRPVSFADPAGGTPEMSAHRESQHNLRQRFGYADPQDLPPNQADQIFPRWLEMTETELQPDKIHAYLDEAAELAAVARNIAFLRVVHWELEQFNGDQSIDGELVRWMNRVADLAELDLKNTLELKIAYQQMLNWLEKDGRIEFQSQIESLTEVMEKLSRTHRLYGFARESGLLR